MNKNRPKLALALAGGGLGGFVYEIGCLKAFEDFFNGKFKATDFDIYVGTSAGASLGALLANGLSIQRLHEAIKTSQDRDLRITRRDVYQLDFKIYGQSLLKILEGMAYLLKKALFSPKKFSFSEIPFVFAECLPTGIYSLEHFERFFAHLLSRNRLVNHFDALKKELYITANNLDTAKRAIFGKGYKDVPIAKAVAASSAIPIYFRPVTIDGEDYVDGGLGKVAHIDVAIDQGATFIVVINPIVPISNDQKRLCIKTHRGYCARIKDRGLNSIWEQAYRIEIYTKLQLGLRRFQVEHPHVNVFLIEPEKTEATMFFANSMDFKDRLTILRYAYESTLKTLKENAAFLAQWFP